MTEGRKNRRVTYILAWDKQIVDFVFVDFHIRQGQLDIIPLHVRFALQQRLYRVRRGIRWKAILYAL